MLYSRHGWPFFQVVIEIEQDSMSGFHMKLEIYHSIVFDIASITSKLIASKGSLLGVGT